MPAPTKVTVVRISFALINISHKPEAINSFRFVPLGYDTLEFPPKSKFVEKENKMKSLLFRHFIYVNLGIAVEVCQNLLLAAKTHKNHRKTQNSFVPYLTSACPAHRLYRTENWLVR